MKTQIATQTIEWSNNKNPHECAWCFEKMSASRIAVYGFVFCSPKCSFSHKEFEDQFKK